LGDEPPVEALPGLIGGHVKGIDGQRCYQMLLGRSAQARISTSTTARST
jgi:hypothetical protein